MATLWIVTVLALLVAVAALMHSRHNARKLAEVTHLYWQLKSDYGELKAKVNPPPPSTPAPQQTFVPLSSIKKT